MSSKLAEQRSISSQLVVLFTLAAILLLSAGLGGFYWIVVRHAFEEDNAVLTDKVSALRAQITEPQGPRALQEQLNARNLREHAIYWVRVSEADGRILAESPGMEEQLPNNLFPAPPSKPPGMLAPVDYRRGGMLFSLVTTSQTVSGQPITIQVAQDRSADQESTRQFGTLLAAVLALGILAAALIAVSVTRRGLRPLKEMTNSLRRVGPTQLHDRLGGRGWPRELQPMAAAFDEMLNRLEDSFIRLSQFSADLAHELRTPIANILGEAEVSLTRERTPDEYREVILSSVAECTRLSAIIDNLLFLARAESTDRQIHPTSFPGREAVQKIAAYYETSAEEKGITIRCEGDDQIYADPLLFGRALSNLLDNALRFAPDGGQIVIRLSAVGKATTLSVQDKGPGIPREHIAKVFDRFYQVDASRTSSGSGLGLALVKSIAEMHGGSASVNSSVGQGTTVTLAFPHYP